MNLIDYENINVHKVEEFKKAERILRKVQNHFKEDIQTKRRMREIVYARFLYYRLCRDLTKLSLYEIGKTVGFDHASVINGLKQYDNFAAWGMYDYIKSHKDICKEFGDYTRADKVEDLIKENIKLRHQIKRYKEIIGV